MVRIIGVRVRVRVRVFRILDSEDYGIRVVGFRI